MSNRKLLFALLLKSAQHTIVTLDKDEKYIGATPGIVSILHTNGQDLNFHPHIHNIVSGGGILPSPGGEGPGDEVDKRKEKQWAFFVPTPGDGKNVQRIFFRLPEKIPCEGAFKI